MDGLCQHIAVKKEAASWKTQKGVTGQHRKKLLSSSCYCQSLATVQSPLLAFQRPKGKREND